MVLCWSKIYTCIFKIPVFVLVRWCHWITSMLAMPAWITSKREDTWHQSKNVGKKIKAYSSPHACMLYGSVKMYPERLELNILR